MRSLIAALLWLGLLAACKDKPTTGWVDPQSLQQGPIRQALTPIQRDRIRKLQQTFAEVDSTPLEKWFEDFSRDQSRVDCGRCVAK